MQITNTIYSQHCGEATREEIDSYAEAVAAMIRSAYPEAEVSTEIFDHVSGSGAGISSDDPEVDTDELNAMRQDIWDRMGW